MKINKQKLMELTGIKLEHDQDIIYLLQFIADFLESHNKNYTKEQYNKICDLKAIAICLESEE